MSGLTGMFVGFHATMAMLTNSPELAIERDEAADFFKAVKNVSRHYRIETNQKAVDWAVLFGAGFSIWGTRAFAISQRLKAEREAKGEGQVLRYRRPSHLRPVEPAAPAAPAAPGASASEPFTPSTPMQLVPDEEAGF